MKNKKNFVWRVFRSGYDPNPNYQISDPDSNYFNWILILDFGIIKTGFRFDDFAPKTRLHLANKF